MSISASVSSNALSYLQSLMQQSMSGAGDAASSDPLSLLLDSAIGSPDQVSQAGQGGQTNGQANVMLGATASALPFGTETLGALLSAQGQNAQTLFTQMDANSDGQVSKPELENALGQYGVSASDADAIFNKLDANGDGTVTQSEFDSAKTGHAHAHHHHGGAGSAQGGSQSGGANAQSSSSSATSNADGSTTQTTTNPDGSTTTVTTYPDGTTMTSTVAAAQSAGQSNGNAANPNLASLMQMLSQAETQFLNPAVNLLSTFV